MNYLDWNHRICTHVFKPKKRGTRVWLYITEDIIDELGQEEGKGLDDFVNAVKEGYGLAKAHRNVCDAAHAWIECRWRRLDQAGFEGPPYLAYLALFVLAAGHGDRDEYHPNMYYKRLNDLLGRGHEKISSGQFSKIDDLWVDLEMWANIDKDGKYGLFQVQDIGYGTHVGKAIAQSLLSETEVEGVKSVFYKFGYTPDVLPTDAELASVILSNGRKFLTSRTKRILTEGESEIKDALLDLVQELLESWDGEAPDSVQSQDEATSRSYSGSMFWNLLLDEFDSIREIRVRCSTASDLPEEPLVLLHEPTGKVMHCEEFRTGWTTPLRCEDDSFLQADQFDWSTSEQLADKSKGWSIHSGSNRLRILVEGSSIGLPGFIETKQLPSSGPVIFAVNGEDKSDLLGWLQADGERSPKEINSSAIPNGWTVLKVGNLPSPSKLESPIPSLSRNTRVSMSLVGGLKHSKPNEYFTFAPPVIRVRTTSEKEVLCNSVQLEGSGDYYRLEEHHIRQHRVVIEVQVNGKTVKSRTIYFHDQVQWPLDTQEVAVDKLGFPSEDGAISGSMVTVDQGSEKNPSIYPQLPELFSRRVFLVGREPGQIVSWPQEGLPDWPVIWAIPLTRRGSAVYCGTDLSSSAPCSNPSSESRQRISDWKKVLYLWRKRITPPPSPSVRTLWREYQRIARDV